MPHDELVPGRSDITLEGWQTDPQLRWSLQHVAEMFPCAEIAPAATPTPLPAHPVELETLPLIVPLTGVHHSVAEVMAACDTDAWAVLHGGHLVIERYERGMTPPSPHLLMSVSKSVIGVVAGALVDRGALEVDRPVTHYVPALIDTGYDGATVRHL
ncbi:MAG: serine hydrolase domain-containing protein, partial [Marmoricola sp.]